MPLPLETASKFIHSCHTQAMPLSTTPNMQVLTAFSCPGCTTQPGCSCTLCYCSHQVILGVWPQPGADRCRQALLVLVAPHPVLEALSQAPLVARQRICKRDPRSKLEGGARACWVGCLWGFLVGVGGEGGGVGAWGCEDVGLHGKRLMGLARWRTSSAPCRQMPCSAPCSVCQVRHAGSRRSPCTAPCGV